ncbi:MAG TPA: hypothetical protein PLD20_19565, partial [Blastocatellia bacterium]|nr:hypothetical protein [Blastocatellia bacterium]
LLPVAFRFDRFGKLFRACACAAQRIFKQWRLFLIKRLRVSRFVRLIEQFDRFSSSFSQR